MATIRVVLADEKPQTNIMETTQQFSIRQWLFTFLFKSLVEKMVDEKIALATPQLQKAKQAHSRTYEDGDYNVLFQTTRDKDVAYFHLSHPFFWRLNNKDLSSEDTSYCASFKVFGGWNNSIDHESKPFIENIGQIRGVDSVDVFLYRIVVHKTGAIKWEDLNPQITAQIFTRLKEKIKA
jgi:hypothetical protein